MPLAEHATTERVVRHFIDACNAGDAEAVSRTLADEATFTLWGGLAVSGTVVGRRAIVEDFLPAARALFRPGTLRLEPDTLIVDAKHAAAEVTARGVSAAGDPYRNSYCIVFDVDDGQIRAVREYMDTAYAERVLGGARDGAP